MYGSRSSYLKPNFIVEAGMPICLHFFQSNTIMRPEKILKEGLQGGRPNGKVTQPRALGLKILGRKRPKKVQFSYEYIK